MPHVTEKLDQGLVTARSAAFLLPGEMARMLNSVYVPESVAVRRSPGRLITPGTQPGGDISGLIHAQFDNGTGYLVAQSASKFNVSANGFIGPYSNGGASTGTSLLGRAHYNDKFYIFNGADTNRVLRNDGTLRTMGLSPVISPCTLLSASSGTFSTTSSGYYEYWVTEVAEISENGKTTILESNYETEPLVVSVSSSLNAQTILVPPPVNTNATYRKIYRSSVKTTIRPFIFPIGELIGTIDIGADRFIDGVGAGGAFTLPTAAANVSGVTNPNNMLDDGTGTTNVATFTPTPMAFAGSAEATLTGFNITAPAEPIVGIEMTVDGRVTLGNANNTVIAHIWFENISNPAKVSHAKIIPFVPNVSPPAAAVKTVGGPSDLWMSLPSGNPYIWNASDFTNANLKVHVKFYNGKYISGTNTMDIDCVKIKIYSAGTAGAAGNGAIGDPFPAVSVIINGDIFSTGSNGKPPIASTGDVFQDSVVVNDVANPSFVRWSLPNGPEYFPGYYFFDFETPNNDSVTQILQYNDKLLIGLANQLWRMDYLPNEDDAVISRGRATTLLDPHNGPVNARSMTLFRHPDGRMLAAYVSRNGLMATDSYTTWPLIPQIAWDNLITTAGFATAQLYNNPNKWELQLLYRPAAESAITRRLHISYHPMHVRADGTLKVSGPTVISNKIAGVEYFARCSTPVLKTDGSQTIFTAYSNGDIYADSDTTAIPHDLKFRDILTRKMYMANLGGQWKFINAHPYFEYEAATSGMVLQPTVSQTGKTDRLVSTTKTTAPTFTGLFRNMFGEGTFCEALQLNAYESALTATDKLGLVCLVIEGTGMGAEHADG